MIAAAKEPNWITNEGKFPGIGVQMFMIETHRSFVTSKNCDGNGHMNVAAYVELFSHAGQNLFADNNLGKRHYHPRDRHFRFHSEIRNNTALKINSIVVGRGSHAGYLFHALWDDDNNRLSATCLDAPFDNSFAKLPMSMSGAPNDALPRGIQQIRMTPVDTKAMLQDRSAIRAYRGRTEANQSDRSETADQRMLVEKFFNSANHLWRQIGLKPAWFSDNNVGGVALEMKLAFHQQVARGQDFEMISWVPEISEKTVRLSHQMNSLPDGDPLASISALAVLMDLGNRTIVNFPKSAIANHQSRFSQIRNYATY